MKKESLSPGRNKRNGGGLVFLLALGGALAVLFHQGFLPRQTHFANDMPLGWMLDSSHRLPGTFAGHWDALYWIGSVFPTSSPSVWTLLQTVLAPEIFLKVFAPFSLLFLGASAWLFFRQLGLAAPVCVLGGLGAGLNMHFFSNACWGLGQWNLAAGMVFITMSVLVSPVVRPNWAKAALAGLAAGLAVVEGFDMGAILSLYAGIFVVFFFLTEESSPVKAMPKTIGMGTGVALCAILISSSTIYTLVGTSIKGVSKAGENAAEKQAHWEFTTQWSLPKAETFSIVVPGAFGYRMLEFITGTNKASSYWGKLGEDAHIDELESGRPETRAQAAASLGLPAQAQKDMASDNLAVRENIVSQVKGQLQRRYTGQGVYMGVLVGLLAFFALFNSWRKRASLYSRNERQAVWFWSVAALISLLLAWGCHAPFYQFVYHLPFINNIRNPIKFLYPMNLCLITLSAYGLEALHRGYLRDAAQPAGSVPTQIARWWRNTSGFAKQWAIGTLVVLAAALVGLLILSASRENVIHFMTQNGIAEDLAPQLAAFCVGEVAWSILFYAASAGVVIGILSGVWGGSRTPWAWIILGALLVMDLGRADAPWVHYFNYEEKYSTNPVIDFLRHEPWEHRVTSRRSPTGRPDITEGVNVYALCHYWLEHLYLANDIQTLELDQAPRLPQLDKNYMDIFASRDNIMTPRDQRDYASPARLWRLTNTRYIIADAKVTAELNQKAEPKNSFREVMCMDLAYKPGVTVPEDAGDLTVGTNASGAIALIEFTAALPRARLYANWQVTDDQTALDKLGSPAFDPAATVLVATNTPLAQTPSQPGADPGSVAIVSYESRDVKLQADAKTPAVLLLNDRTGDDWNVWVDDKPAAVLRCNYIMRGVYVPQGKHTVEFRFQPPLAWLYVSSAALAIGILLFGYVMLTRPRRVGNFRRD